MPVAGGIEADLSNEGIAGRFVSAIVDWGFVEGFAEPCRLSDNGLLIGFLRGNAGLIDVDLLNFGLESLERDLLGLLGVHVDVLMVSGEVWVRFGELVIDLRSDLAVKTRLGEVKHVIWS